jgi:hypothetical protein
MQSITKDSADYEKYKKMFYNDPTTNPVTQKKVRVGNFKPYKDLVDLYGDPNTEKSESKSIKPKSTKKVEEDKPKSTKKVEENKSTKNTKKVEENKSTKNTKKVEEDKPKSTKKVEEDKPNSTKKVEENKPNSTKKVEEDKPKSTKKVEEDKPNSTKKVEEDKPNSTKKVEEDKPNSTKKVEKDKSTKKVEENKSTKKVEENKSTKKIEEDKTKSTKKVDKEYKLSADNLLVTVSSSDDDIIDKKITGVNYDNYLMMTMEELKKIKDNLDKEFWFEKFNIDNLPLITVCKTNIEWIELYMNLEKAKLEISKLIKVAFATTNDKYITLSFKSNNFLSKFLPNLNINYNGTIVIRCIYQTISGNHYDLHNTWSIVFIDDDLDNDESIDDLDTNYNDIKKLLIAVQYYIDLNHNIIITGNNDMILSRKNLIPNEKPMFPVIVAYRMADYLDL